MIDPVHERRTPISPQLAMRVAGLGIVAFVLFAVIFFRLWFLQVLSGDQYVAQATQNRVRVLPQQAPRGFIVDRRGEPLVRNRKAIVLQLDPKEIPEEERMLAAEYGQKLNARARRRPEFRGPRVPIPPVPAQLRPRFAALERLTGLKVADIQERVVVGLSQLPFSPVRIKTDVKPAVRDYIEENREQFPGVDPRTVFLRDYPNGDVGAQLFGQVGQINPDQIDTARYRGVKTGSLVGQSGLERRYDRYLRGEDGQERFFIDAAGQQKGSRLSRSARGGRQLRTSLDLGLQKAAQSAIVRAGNGVKPGAFVAMDPENGQIFAMGSAPSFDPNVLTRPLTEKRSDELFGPDSAAPLVNRATSSIYSTGSTFKPVTALAGLDAGLVTPQTPINDTGIIQLFPGPAGKRQNAGAKAYGSVDLARSLSVSSDIYFYLLGKNIYNRSGLKLQEWASKLGYGKPTGIDVGNEAPGVIPSRAWRDDLNKAEADCRAGRGDYDKATPGGCGIADGTNRPYSAGDNVNLAIGQGDLQATPIQVAVSFAAIANGGRVVKPHLGLRIEDEQGRFTTKLPVGPSRKVDLPADGLAAIREGLRRAAQDREGTSYGIFSDWDHGRFPIFGKTGTAQTSKGDQSWYAAYVPRTRTNKKPLLVVTTVEQGGFGSEAAAPAARQILSRWFYGRAGEFRTVAAEDSVE